MTDAGQPTRQFETEIQIAAEPASVWNALASDIELRRWFAPEAHTESEVGGTILWAWDRHHRWPQRIEVLEPGRRLRTRYDSEVPDGEGGKRPLFIEFTLEGRAGTTTLRLVQSGFGSEAGFDAEYDGISRGWPVELRSLRLYLEQHAGKDRRLAWSTLMLDLDPAEAWRKLVSAEGLGCGTEVEGLHEGEPFHFVSVDGDEFSGKALQCGAREFSGDASSHGGAFLRVSVERWAGQANVWCWLGAYDHGAEELAALQGRWDAMLQRLFVTNGEPADLPGVQA